MTTSTKRATWDRSDARRPMLVAALGAVAMSIGWMTVLKPMQEAVSRRHDALRTAESLLAAHEHHADDRVNVSAQLSDLQSRRTSITEWVRRGGTPAQIYDRIRQLAAHHSIRIVRIEPRLQAAVELPHLGDKSGLTEPEVFGYSLEVAGRYEAIAVFMEAAGGLLGPGKVVSFQIASPARPLVTTGGGVELTASIETTHVRLAFSAAADADRGADK